MFSLVFILIFNSINIGEGNLEFTERQGVDRTIQILRKSSELLNLPPDHKNVTFLIGRPHSGKTSLLLMLKNIYSLRVSKNLKIKDPENLIHHSYFADTAHPNVYIRQVRTDCKKDRRFLVLYDCARIHDEYDISMEIASQYFFKKAINHVEQYRFILVLSYEKIKELKDLLTFDAANILANYWSTFITYFSDLPRFKTSLSLVVTKVDVELENNQKSTRNAQVTQKILKNAVINFISMLNDSLVKGPPKPSRRQGNKGNYKPNPFQKKATLFLQHFLINKNFVHIIRSPDASGFLKDDFMIDYDITTFERMLKKLTFVKKDVMEFQTIRHDYVRDEYDNFALHILKETIQTIDDIAKDIIEYYKMKVASTNDIYTLMGYLQRESKNLHVVIKKIFKEKSMRKFHRYLFEYIVHLQTLKFDVRKLKYLKDTETYWDIANELSQHPQKEENKRLIFIVKWHKPIVRIKNYVDDAYNWIYYLLNLHEKLHRTHFRKNRIAYFQTVKTSKDVSKLLQKLYTYDIRGYQKVSFIRKFTPEMIKVLNQVLEDSRMNLDFKKNKEYYNNTYWTKLKFTGYNLRTSIVPRKLHECEDQPCIIQLFARNNLIIDSDLIINTSNVFQLHMVAPSWTASHTSKKHFITGDGLAIVRNDTIEFGEDGRPGNPANCIAGFGNEVFGQDDLIISSCGGDGENGKDGKSIAGLSYIDLLDDKQSSILGTKYVFRKTMNECVDFIKNTGRHFAPSDSAGGYRRLNDKITDVYDLQFKGLTVQTSYEDIIGGKGGEGGPNTTSYLYFNQPNVFALKNSPGKPGRDGRVGYHEKLLRYQEPDFYAHYIPKKEICAIYHKGYLANEIDEMEIRRAARRTHTEFDKKSPISCRSPSLLLSQYITYASRYFKDMFGKEKLLLFYYNYFTNVSLIQKSAIDYEKAFSQIEKTIDDEKNVDIKLILANGLIYQLYAATKIKLIRETKPKILHFMHTAILGKYCYLSVVKTSNISLNIHYTFDKIRKSMDRLLQGRFTKAVREIRNLFYLSVNETIQIARRLHNIFTDTKIFAKNDYRKQINIMSGVLDTILSIFDTFIKMTDRLCYIENNLLESPNCHTEKKINWEKTKSYLVQTINRTVLTLTDPMYVTIAEKLRFIANDIFIRGSWSPGFLNISGWEISPICRLVKTRLRYIADRVLENGNDIAASYIYLIMHEGIVLEITYDRFERYFLHTLLYESMPHIDSLRKHCKSKLCHKYFDKIARYIILEWDIIIQHELEYVFVPFGQDIMKDLFQLNVNEPLSILMRKFRSNLYNIPVYFKYSDNYFNDINSRFTRTYYLPDGDMFYRHSAIFGQWTNERYPNLLRRLAKGKKIYLQVEPDYDIRKGQVIEMVNPRIDIRPNNCTHIDQNVLRSISVRMKHMGISYFRCADLMYVSITPMKVFKFNLLEKNTTFETFSLVKQNPVSPHSLWEITLRGDGLKKLRFYKNLTLSLEGAVKYPNPIAYTCKGLPYYIDDTTMGLAYCHWPISNKKNESKSEKTN